MLQITVFRGSLKYSRQQEQSGIFFLLSQDWFAGIVLAFIHITFCRKFRRFDIILRSYLGSAELILTDYIAMI
jgi:hypothetical protein